MEKNEITVVRRDTLERQTCKLGELMAVIQKLAEQMTKDLRQRAWQWMKDHVHRVENLQEARELLEKRAGIVEVFWCGKAECGHELEGEIKARVLGVPEDIEEKVDGKCVVCGQKASSVVRVALAY
jgi:prolyl-tRNA synthetase